MPGGEEITELRTLQERAYRRTGETRPEAARLRELADDASKTDVPRVHVDPPGGDSMTVARSTYRCDDTDALINDGGSLTMTRPEVDAGASTTGEYRFGPGSSHLQITRSTEDAGS